MAASAGQASRLVAEIDRLLGAGRPAVADLLLPAISTVHPPDGLLAILRARVALACANPAQAIAALERCPANDPAAGPVQLWRARAWLAAGDPAHACEAASAAAAAAPADPDPVGLFATLLIETGQAGRAIHLLDAAIARGAPGDALHVALGVALLTIGQTQVAQAVIRRGLATHPASAALLRLQAAQPPSQGMPA